METKAPKTFGHVSLISAGPDAADPVAMCGARLLGEAEVVLHGALVSPGVFQYYPQAVLIATGKRYGERSAAQRFISHQPVGLTTKYQRVMHLRRGGPMLFDRADKELQVSEQAGVSYEIVPGITAALAAASATRQPLTKRSIARSVAFTTQAKATDPDTPQPEDAVPEPVAQADSLVYYMGRDQAASIAADLVARGRAPSTPAWVVEVVAAPEQRSMCFTLQQMASDAAAKWINAEHPSLLMIGDTLTVRASAAVPEPTLDAHPHSLAAWATLDVPALSLTPPSSRSKNPPRYNDSATGHGML